MCKQRAQTGFTLIELMIVVLVVAILAAIAYPNYLDYTRKSRRGDAMAELQRIQLGLEQWRANNPSYVGAGAGYPAPGTVPHYTVAIAAVAANSYRITATATGGQTADNAGGTSCSTLAIESAGAGTVTRTPADCFRK